MKKTAALSIRILQTVKDATDQAAEDDDRSTSSYVERILAAHLREKGYLPSKDDQQ